MNGQYYLWNILRDEWIFDTTQTITKTNEGDYFIRLSSNT
jgi:hypothetical protein